LSLSLLVVQSVPTNWNIFSTGFEETLRVTKNEEKKKTAQFSPQKKKNK